MESSWTVGPPYFLPQPVAGEKRRSQTIPLPSSHITRTQSENQLHEDMVAAEWRDLCMFYRVVHGIRERQTTKQGKFAGLSVANGVENPRVENLYQARNQNNHHTNNNAFGPVQSTQMETSDCPSPTVAVGGFLSSCVPIADDDGSDPANEWSITGFDDDGEEPIGDNHVAIVETDDLDTESSDGVFSMDL